MDHLKAVPVGARVSASARLSKIQGRFLEFVVEARSGGHVIGRGKVFRAIVEPQRFHHKAKARAHAEQLLKLAADSDGTRPEIAIARQRIAGN